VLGLLAALGPLSIDLYPPAFPELRQDLHGSAAAVQFTLAGMTLGLALGQAVVGAWSDRVGRRGPLLLSTALHLVATIACALAPSIEVLTACRFAQGVGAAGSAVLVLAIVRDVADGRTLVVLLSRVTLVETVAPLLAPVAGAELLPLVGWRGIFGVLAAGSAALLVAALLLVPETAGRASGPGRLRTRLRAVRADRDFRLATVSGSMTFAGVYAYVAASPRTPACCPACGCSWPAAVAVSSAPPGSPCTARAPSPAPRPRSTGSSRSRRPAWSPRWPA
jgi:DHA1 family bicyclomycin/chloramphenicol resistance-like MFS transporter